MRIPENVRNVAHLIGMDKAVQLMTVTHSNGSIYIPHGSRPSLLRSERQLSNVLTEGEIKALQREFGGVALSYPSRRGALRMARAESRKKRILAMASSGSSVILIAQSAQCSDNYVRRVLKKGTTSSGWKRKPIINENVRNNDAHE